MGDLELGREAAVGNAPDGEPDPAATRTTRVMVVEGEAMVAGAFAAVCEREPDLVVVGTASTAADAEQLAARTHPDVAVVDDRLPDGDPAEATRRIRRAHPAVRTVIVASATDDRTFHRAIQEHIEGYLVKGQSVHQLVEAIRTLAAGGTSYAPDVLSRLVARVAGGQSHPQQLSDREVEVLQLLADGRSTSGVADTMHISVNTVRNHVQHVLRKLGSHSRLEAVAAGMRAGLIDQR
jgi:DNA-binding NarL/FixJ family response regulator